MMCCVSKLVCLDGVWYGFSQIGCANCARRIAKAAFYRPLRRDNDQLLDGYDAYNA